MKKTYVRPVLSSSMEGTLEGVYAYASTNGQLRCLSTNNGGNNSDDNGGNGGNNDDNRGNHGNQGGYYFLHYCGHVYGSWKCILHHVFFG